MKGGFLMETPIADLDRYNGRMQKSLIDKIFFMDKVDAEQFIDFGCADGSLILMLKKLFPEHLYTGYDTNKKMIELANKDSKEVSTPLPTFTSDWKKVKRLVEMGDWRDSTCIILMSIIHEIYSYGPEKVQEFWKQIWDLAPKYIAIRDMCVSRTASRPADPLSVARVRQLHDTAKIAQWEARWGALDENWSLVHYLLSYHYEDNWEREYQENYLPLCKEDLLSLIPENYVPDYIEHYTLPYLRRKIEDDLGIQLQERTHLKLILRRMD
jgi:hypothetical protein